MNSASSVSSVKTMSAFTDALSRNYIHRECDGATKVSKDDYVALENPFKPVSGTYCAVCRRFVPLEDVCWADTGALLSDDRKEIAAGVPAGERTRLSKLANIYEGALRLNLDAHGNPKGGPRSVMTAEGIVTTLPVPADQAEIVAAMKELGDALIELAPKDARLIRCEITRAPAGAGRALQFAVTCDANVVAANNRVDLAGSRVVRKLSPSLKAFPGLTMSLERLENGQWRNQTKLADGGAS